jgi:hypothetical protein
MSRYKIVSLNYMTSGPKRTLINMDTQVMDGSQRTVYILSREMNQLSNIVTEQADVSYLPTDYIEKEHPILDKRPVPGDFHSEATEPLSEEDNVSSIILNEHQRYGYETGLSAFRILLQLSSNQISVEERCADFRKCAKNGTFVIEGDKENRNIAEDVEESFPVYPIYDIRDVAIKSYVQKVQTNRTLSVNEEYLGKFVDIYFPDMHEYPIGFCQKNNDAYVITEKTPQYPYYLNTTLLSDRMNPEVDDYYGVFLSSGEIGVNLYSSLNDYGVSSFHQELSGSGQVTSFFTPKRSLGGIRHNYVLAVDQTDYDSVYDTGDIYAQQIDMAKNSYNSLYSMQVSANEYGKLGILCREYCGINTDGNEIYLKYFDNAVYSQVSSESGVPEKIRMETDEGGKKYPFQKIESFIPNNFQTACKHKSNLFSINVENKMVNGLKDVADENGTVLYDTVYAEVKNAIKTIAENICPVNTQFFDVYFDK